LPWATLDANDFPAEIVFAARKSFTEGAWNEYRTGAAFLDLSHVLLRAGAPIDLVAMAADFAVDEMAHVELNARVAMALGGPTTLEVDALHACAHADAQRERLRACEIAVRLSCVAEALSAPLLAMAARAATQPLVRAVLLRLASDEGAHGAMGHHVLAWAESDLDAAARRHLARAATEEIDALFADWKPLAHASSDRPNDAAWRALGFVSGPEFLAAARRTLESRVVAPLARVGIVIEEGARRAVQAA
jgi:hypothetical protein